jgi:hypothetical protein
MLQTSLQACLYNVQYCPVHLGPALIGLTSAVPTVPQQGYSACGRKTVIFARFGLWSPQSATQSASTLPLKSFASPVISSSSSPPSHSRNSLPMALLDACAFRPCRMPLDHPTFPFVVQHIRGLPAAMTMASSIPCLYHSLLLHLHSPFYQQASSISADQTSSPVVYFPFDRPMSCSLSRAQCTTSS